MHPERLGQLHKLGGAVVGRIEFPPELESEHTLVEPARPLTIGDTQPDMVEDRSVPLIAAYLDEPKSVIMQR